MLAGGAVARSGSEYEALVSACMAGPARGYAPLPLIVSIEGAAVKPLL
jgi:hypothetical protein